jgi:hypothetical protein
LKWCSKTELKERILNYVEKINAGKLDEGAIMLYGSVYSAFNNLEPYLRVILKKTMRQKFLQQL